MTKLLKRIDVPFRITVFFMVVTLGVFFIFFGAKAALAADLKSSSTIAGSVITVGDVFDGIEQDKADHILGPSPKPGQHITLNARTLTRIAMAMDLKWRASEITDHITLKRGATIIDQDMIIEAVKGSLGEKGLDGNFRLQLFTENPQMLLSPEVSGTIEIGSLEYSPTNNIFEAHIYAPSVKNAVSELVLSGKVQPMISVPVLSQTVRYGETISANDIHWIDLPDREVQHDIVLNTSEIIGMTPRRMVMAGKPIRDRDIELPKVVKRGDNVIILYELGALSLTAEGKALEDGAKDDVIRIVNTSSHRPIEAFVVGEGTVTVSQ